MPVRRYLTGQGLSHVQNLENDTFHAYHQDEQGSTAYVTGITGEIENLYSYDGFGNILESRAGIQNRILYTGQQYDQETGQYYLRARYYNPVIGRFTQEDTYRGDGLNLYAYCDNNPVMYYDPSGHIQLWYDDDYDAAGKTRAAGINNNSNVNSSGQGIEGGSKADLGNKLDYQFGIAGGNKHSIDRTNGLKTEMDKLGFDDTPQNRTFFEQYYNDILNDASNIVGDPKLASYTENGVKHYYTVTTRKSFLMGKYGGAKVTTHWDGNRLLTTIISSGKETRYTP